MHRDRKWQLYLNSIDFSDSEYDQREYSFIYLICSHHLTSDMASIISHLLQIGGYIICTQSPALTNYILHQTRPELLYIVILLYINFKVIFIYFFRFLLHIRAKNWNYLTFLRRTCIAFIMHTENDDSNRAEKQGDNKSVN